MSTPIAKALQRDIAPTLLAGLLYLGSGLGLLVVMLVRRTLRITLEAPVRREEWPLAAGDHSDRGCARALTADGRSIGDAGIVRVAPS